MRRIFLLALLLAFASTAVSAATTTVILVRHAERVEKDGDVPLIEPGFDRAKELARVLADANVSAIYVTQWQRTLQTVEPLSAALKLTPVKFDTGPDYAKSLVADIRGKHQGETVLVAGHSDSTANVLRELGIQNPPKIAHTQYDSLFIVTFDGTEAGKLTVLRFGAHAR